MLYKQKKDHINEHLSVKIQEIKENKAVYSVKILVFKLDQKLNFILHIRNICKFAASQLNVLN